MLISHHKHFIFIHNYKVAGVSIKRSLSGTKNAAAELGELTALQKRILSVWSNNSLYRLSDHMTAAELKKEIPAGIFKRYFKFGFVRNPWDHQVSLYEYMRSSPDHFQHKEISMLKDFEEYIDWRVNRNVHFQKDFFFEGDECLVDFIGKYEHLERDFQAVCRRLGILAGLQHLNKSPRYSDYRQYYSSRTIELVAEAFDEDIRLFGYEKPALG